MTQPLKTTLKTAWKALFLRARRRPYPKRDGKTRKIPGAVTVSGDNVCPKKFTGKELDLETGLYYFGARYLDSKTSRWISGDPAVGDYLPSAPVNGEAKKRNGNLPGQGGVFNTINLHTYSYSLNNPVRYTDPDGRSPRRDESDERKISNAIDRIAGTEWGKTEFGERVVNYLRANISLIKIAPVSDDRPAQIIPAGNHEVKEIRINPIARANQLPALLAHEGTHAVDLIHEGFDKYSYRHERRATNNQFAVDFELNRSRRYDYSDRVLMRMYRTLEITECWPER
jgi:RHS repeat-associated protein